MFKLLLKYGRIRTLLGVRHILNLARSVICISNLYDTSVDTLLGNTYSGGCNSFVVHGKINKE
jgi:hypothetical protein